MNNFFDNKLNSILLILLFPLLFLPKINLISVGSETAGLRIDDLFLLCFGALLMLAHYLSGKKLHKIEGWILLITAFSILSFFSNRLLVALEFHPMDAKIFYAVRLLEYFMFFYIGAIASKYINCKTVILLFFVWNLLWMSLQKLGFIGAMTSTGYDSDASSRVFGVASFPSEMGLILNLLFCYLIFDPQTSRFVKIFPSPIVRDFLEKSYLYWMFALFSLFVIFTGNRISMLALLICFLFRLKQELRSFSVSSVFLICVFIPLTLVGSALLITNTAAIYERSAGLFSLKNIELAGVVWDQIDLSKNPVGNEVIAAKDYDASWWMRIHKWIHVAKAFSSHPIHYLQGLGPGFAWAALDGGFLRIVVENGLIGAWLYWQFFSCIYRINPQIKWMSIAFFMNMVFFDAYLAYKTMSLFLFAAGDGYAKARLKEDLKP